MSSTDAKNYLSKRNVPALFECLMTGLMFHRPTDHIQYLIECLEKAKAKGQEELRWNMFIEMQRSKTPLPPITPSNGRRPISRERSMTPKEERSSEPRVPTPLPPIRDKSIPDVPVIFLMGGPGSGKSTQADLLVKSHPGWVTIAMGELLRKEVAEKGDADDRWKMVSDLMSKGELVPEEVVDSLLLTRLMATPDVEGFVIQGFPRDMEQAMQYDKKVGRVDAVFLLDCEEETLSKQLMERASDDGRLDNNVNTIAKRILAFKEKTLPVLKHYDDMEKLFILEGEKSVEEIAEDLALVFETVVGSKGKLSPAPPKEPRPERTRTPQSGRTSPRKVKTPSPEPKPSSPSEKEDDAEEAPLPAHLMPPEVKVKDEGRKPDMPQAPIIFIAGGPGSGKGTQCKRLMSRYTDGVHLSMGDILRTKITSEGSADQKWDMVTDLLRKGDLAPEELTIDLLINALKEKPDAHFYLVEGFPRNLEQLEDFNKHIGGHNFTILLDCEERVLHFRLSVRGKESERIDDNLTAIGNKLTYFRNNTLPILKTIEDSGKLVVVSGDKDEDEINYDLCKVLDFAIYGTLPEVQAAAETKEPVKEDVVEPAIVPASATVTGDNIANPSYSAELDATEVQKSEDAKAAESSQDETTVSTQDTSAADTTMEVSKETENEENKAEEKTNEDPKADGESKEEVGKVEESSQEEAVKTEEPQEEAVKTEEPQEEAVKTEEPQEEAVKTGEPQEEATKIAEETTGAEDVSETTKAEEESAQAEGAIETDDSTKAETEEPGKTEEESPKTEAASVEEETANADETPKTEEETATTEETSVPEEETAKAEETAKPDDASGTAQAVQETVGETVESVSAEDASAGEASEQKPADEAAPVTEEAMD